MSSDELMWTDGSQRDLFDARILKLRGIQRSDYRGRRGEFILVDAPDWVTVIPELPGSSPEKPDFLIVRQYRHGSGRLSLEFPAGVLETGENPLEAASRELLEETGYRGTSIQMIGSINPNPAFMTNSSKTFLATGLEKVGELNLDEHELLDVHRMGFDDIARSMGMPPYDSAIMVQAWFWYLRATNRL